MKAFVLIVLALVFLWFCESGFAFIFLRDLGDPERSFRHAYVHVRSSIVKDSLDAAKSWTSIDEILETASMSEIDSLQYETEKMKRERKALQETGIYQLNYMVQKRWSVSDEWTHRLALHANDSLAVLKEEARLESLHRLDSLLQNDYRASSFFEDLDSPASGWRVFLHLVHRE